MLRLFFFPHPLREIPPPNWLCEPLHLSPRCFSLRLRRPQHLLPQSREEQQRLSPSQFQLYVCEGCSAPVGIFYRCSPPNVTIFIPLLEIPAEAMGAFGVIIGILQYAGLYFQLNAALNVGHGEVDNHISGNGKLFCAFVCWRWLNWKKKKLLISELISTLEEEWLGGVQSMLFADDLVYSIS